MIKNLKEYRQYSSKLLNIGITAEESAKIKNDLKVFKDNNPSIFEEMQRKKFVWSRSDVVITD